MPPIYSAFKYIIYKDGSTYVAQRYDGTVIRSDSDSADSVFQAALDGYLFDDPGSGRGPGHIYVQSGLYSLSSAFTGFNVYSLTHLTMDPTAYLSVPNGYSGHVFQLHSDNGAEVLHTTIDGGTIREDTPRRPDGTRTPAQRRWTAILLDASATTRQTGVLFNKIVNMNIYDANIGIQLRVDGERGFVNSNSFQFLKMWRHNIFIDFASSIPRQPGQEQGGINRNHFSNIECQSGDNTRHGVRDIRHVCNAFFDVKVWDIGNGTSANVHEEATNTIILGGIMTVSNFRDDGKYTKILDQWYGFRLGDDTNRATSAAMIGTAPDQKVGFFGVPPVTQRTGPAATADSSYNVSERDMLNAVYNALKEYGLIRTP